MFAGETAQTADHDALREAKALAARGWEPELIWRQTGWFQSERRWRFEIDDGAGRMKMRPAQGLAPTPLGAMLEHPALYAAYPQLARLPVHCLHQEAEDWHACYSRLWWLMLACRREKLWMCSASGLARSIVFQMEQVR